MLTQALSTLAIALACALWFVLVWGVPIYFINRQPLVTDREKKLWIIASIFLPWIAFLAFVVLAPVKSLREH